MYVVVLMYRLTQRNKKRDAKCGCDIEKIIEVVFVCDLRVFDRLLPAVRWYPWDSVMNAHYLPCWIDVSLVVNCRTVETEAPRYCFQLTMSDLR